MADDTNNTSLDDSVTVTTTEGEGSRLAGSLKGLAVGLLLIVIGIGLLYWNEGRAVQAARALAEGAGEVVEANAAAPSPAAENQLVHVVGTMAPIGPARDPLFGAAGNDTLRLERVVEMFQWNETKSSQSTTSFGGSKTTTTTYSYKKKWSDHPIPSGLFHEKNNHNNPPMPIQSTTTTSDQVKLGAYRVDPGVTSQLTEFTPIAPLGPIAGYRVDGDYLYRGADTANPQIGDVRVKFAAIRQETVTVVAGQSGTTLAPFRGRNGYIIALAKPGVEAAKDIFREKRQEESKLTWILRGVGFGMEFLGFLLMTQPLVVLASVLPFLEGIMQAGTALVALAFALPVTFLTIAIAWFAHRPLLGIGLLVAGLVVPVALHFRHRGAPRIAVAPAAVAQTPAAAPTGAAGSQLTGWMKSGPNPPPQAGEGR